MRDISDNNNVLNIFLSSTGRDLQAQRDDLYDVLRKIHSLKCIRMEDFTASVDSAAEHCKKMVQKCDLFIGIIGHYYGSIPPKGYEISYTELEFLTAQKLEKPGLFFMATDNFHMPAGIRESDKFFEKQKEFRKRILEYCMPAIFKDSNELTNNVMASLMNTKYLSDIKIAKAKMPQVIHDDYLIFIEYADGYEHKKEIVWTSPWKICANDEPLIIKRLVFFKQSNLQPIEFDFTKGILPKKVQYSGSNPRFIEYKDGTTALFLERTSTNHLKDSENPKDQYVNIVGKGKYIFWVEGSGKAIIKIKELKNVVTEEAPFTFETESYNCAITVKIIGQLNRFQLEDGSKPTSFIKTTNEYIVSRASNILYFDVPSSVSII
ncbi:DUF4062 domain-containing protein [Desulforegula conservatrix]|uniref:DUF4062 domain-containing protein n=1 Tax=Desulforegula conservatrix TaxID=153026 RepID=UPI000416009E|nr:DUF4062 domain-containing protein [Desulforegula conservatrix]